MEKRKTVIFRDGANRPRELRSLRFFDESKIKRADDGKFAPKDGGGSGGKSDLKGPSGDTIPGATIETADPGKYRPRERSPGERAPSREKISEAVEKLFTETGTLPNGGDKWSDQELYEWFSDKWDGNASTVDRILSADMDDIRAVLREKAGP